jgi:hypothetical protein
MIDAIPEAQETRPRSNALLVVIAVCAFMLGVEFAAIVGLRDMIVKEVEGLRADWERDRVQQEFRLERLEETHLKE